MFVWSGYWNSNFVTWEKFKINSQYTQDVPESSQTCVLKVIGKPFLDLEDLEKLKIHTLIGALLKLECHPCYVMLSLKYVPIKVLIGRL